MGRKIEGERVERGKKCTTWVVAWPLVREDFAHFWRRFMIAPGRPNSVKIPEK